MRRGGAQRLGGAVGGGGRILVRPIERMNTPQRKKAPCVLYHHAHAALNRGGRIRVLDVLKDGVHPALTLGAAAAIDAALPYGRCFFLFRFLFKPALLLFLGPLPLQKRVDDGGEACAATQRSETKAR